MATITEDYVSYETAKLLKEKGFLKGVDLRTTQNLSFYDNIGLTHNLNKYYDTLIQDKIDFVVAQTHQMAMKWLREIHNIAINIGWGEIFEDKFQWWCIILNYKDGSILRDSEYYATYEDAVEKAIKYTLEKLI